ncbi:hypothetical protein PTSG_09139 [Salpingoeca rosetta]|uniref:Uncharacterized protein n=1 Tax=Salpingoeca rosetta (strain ATCC 50818 / BSB-021) TaxID=946362 RepID=F2UMU5_SALR5|nr:uncharacterized protein PTSG_09139 [Salpingoeca rosetta]EGD78444.1 hypothetical protein PTSG_09139 [Salpingoeca rosetta]|eukprot:XP_004989393.1 hypothetical protein PTSG_09139 [Salpingoeca rosetta]
MTASNNHNKQHHQQLMHEQQQRRGGSEPPARPPAPAVEAVLAAAHNASARTSRVGGGGTLPGLKGVPLAHGGAQRLDVYLNGEHLIFASANLEHCLRISRITRQWDLIDRAAFDGVYVFGIEDVELIPLHPSTLPKKLNAQSAVPRTAVPASVCCSDRSVVVKEQPRRSAHVAADTLAKLQRRSLPNGETRSTNGRGGGNGGGDGEKGEAHAGTEAGAINGGSRGTSTATEQKDGNKGGGGVADGCAGVDEEDDVTPPLDPATRRIWDRLHRRHVKEIKKMFSLQQGGGFLFSLSGHILMRLTDIRHQLPIEWS